MPQVSTFTNDETYNVNIDNGAEVSETPLIYDEEAENLVPEFEKNKIGLEALKKIAQKIRSEYDTEWQASENYRKQRADDWKIFAGDLPEKDWPFKDCANAHVPIALQNLTRLVCRAHAELFGDETNIFGVVPVGPQDEDIASILTVHGNWQLTEKISDFFVQQSRGLMYFFINGNVFNHSYWDEELKMNRHEILSTDEFLIPYTFTSTMPDLSDCPWRVRIRNYYRHQLEALRGTWANVDKVLQRKAPSWDDEPESPVRDAVAQVDKLDKPEGSQTAPYKVLQYEGWCGDLPNQTRDRFVQVYMDYPTNNIMCLKIYEETPWQEQVRVEREQSEKQTYLMQMNQYQQSLAASQMPPQIDPMTGMPMPPPAPPMPEPPMPPWMINPEDEPAPAQKVPIHMFYRGCCFEPYVGNLGLGYGAIEANFNRAANVSLSQYLDSATLSNCRSFISAGGLEFEGDFRIRPGHINKVSTGASAATLKERLMPIDIGPANPQLMDVVKAMYDWGESAIQSPAVLSGEPGKSGETFRGIATRVEQATKQLSVATRKYARFLTWILKANARLNAIFMPDEEIFSVSHYNGGQPIKINRSLYQRDYKVTIRADLKYSSDAVRIQEADQIVSMATGIPALGANIAFLYAAIKKALEVRGRQDMIALMGPPPPPPDTPLGIPPMPPPGAGLPPGMPMGGPPQGPPGPQPPQGGQPRQNPPPMGPVPPAPEPSQSPNIPGPKSGPVQQV